MSNVLYPLGIIDKLRRDTRKWNKSNVELADLTTYYNSHKTYQYIRTVTLLPLHYNHYITTIILDYHITTTCPCVPWVGRWQLYQFSAGERRRLSLWKWKVSSPKLSTLLILLLAFVSNALFGLEVESTREINKFKIFWPFLAFKE